MNRFQIRGTVVTDTRKYGSGDRTLHKFTILTDSKIGKCYVPCVSIGDMARATNLACKCGNDVIVEGEMCSKAYWDKMFKEYVIKILFVVKEVQLIKRKSALPRADKDIKTILEEYKLKEN